MPKTAAVRLFRTAEDVVVLEDDPRALILLAAPGHQIDDGFDVPAEWTVEGQAPQTSGEQVDAEPSSEGDDAEDKPRRGSRRK